jgi:hypothetical protein
MKQNHIKQYNNTFTTNMVIINDDTKNLCKLSYMLLQHFSIMFTSQRFSLLLWRRAALPLRLFSRLPPDNIFWTFEHLLFFGALLVLFPFCQITRKKFYWKSCYFFSPREQLSYIFIYKINSIIYILRLLFWT